MVTVKIQEDSEQAKAVVEMLKAFPFVEFVETDRYNIETEEAIKEVQANHDLNSAENVHDLMQQLNS